MRWQVLTLREYSLEFPVVLIRRLMWLKKVSRYSKQQPWPLVRLVYPQLTFTVLEVTLTIDLDKGDERAQCYDGFLVEALSYDIYRCYITLITYIAQMYSTLQAWNWDITVASDNTMGHDSFISIITIVFWLSSSRENIFWSRIWLFLWSQYKLNYLVHVRRISQTWWSDEFRK